MIFGTATMTVLVAALLLTVPGRATAAIDTNTAAAAASPSPSPGAANVTLSALPSGVSEVMKMFKGGIPADIMTSYVNNSPLSFYLSADNIISLQQQGLPTPVLTAMIRRYGEMQRQTGMAAGVAGQVPAQAPVPKYYSYAPEDAAASFDTALQARAASSYTYVAAPTYPVYTSVYPDYYDPFYYPYSYPFYGPVVFDFGIGRFGGEFRHVGGFGGRLGGGGVGHFGGVGGGHFGGGGGRVGGVGAGHFGGGGGHVGGVGGGHFGGGGGHSGGGGGRR